MDVLDVKVVAADVLVDVRVAVAEIVVQIVM